MAGIGFLRSGDTRCGTAAYSCAPPHTKLICLADDIHQWCFWLGCSNAAMRRATSRRRELAGHTAKVLRTTGRSARGHQTTAWGTGCAQCRGASAKAFPELTAANVTEAVGN